MLSCDTEGGALVAKPLTFILGAVLLAFAILCLALSNARAQSPTPSDTASATPSPAPTTASTPSTTPFAEPTSTITIRFVQNGRPVAIHGNRLRILANGIPCVFPEPAAPYEIGPIRTESWPLAASSEQPSECSKGPPTTVRFEFSSEFGLLTGEVTWAGADTILDIQVPGTGQAGPPSPASLPTTGGVPRDQNLTNVWLAAAAICSGFMAFLSGLLARKR